MKKILLLSLVFISPIIFNSCTDCPLVESKPIVYCSPREATVTEFNPDVTAFTIKAVDGITDSTYYEPVKEYSIHSYQFPNDDSNSGMTPNDERFNNKTLIPIYQSAFKSLVDNKTYYAAILQKFPANEDIKGDFIVTQVDTLPPTINPLLPMTAKLRFYGFLAPIPTLSFKKENSNDFCTDIIKNLSQAQLTQLRTDKIRFGDSTDFGSFTLADIKIVDIINGNFISDPLVIASLPLSVATSIINPSVSTRKVIHDVVVRPGEVYYYQARNGREFVFAITDIRVGTFEPRKRRMTVMFNAIK